MRFKSIGIAVAMILSILFLVGLVSTDVFAHTWRDGEFMHPGKSDSDWGHGETLGFVYGSVTTIVSWESPTITALHSGYICNYSGGLENWPKKLKGLRFYFKPETTVNGPGNYYQVDRGGKDEGFLDSYWLVDPPNPSYWWKDYHHHRFNLRDGGPGDYTVDAETVITAKYDLDGDGWREEEDWKSEVDDEIEYE